jgi:CubicO group peptidase (beta-lactamase class C family)
MAPATLRRTIPVLVTAGLLLGGSARQAVSQRPSPDSIARWVDSIFTQYAVTSRPAPGCAVGVTRQGELVLSKSYGLADLAQRTPIGPETRFYLASLAKQFTAMSIVLLAQDHRLSLDDDIRKWVPEVPSFGPTITLRHLLNHTSGLRDYLTLLAVTGWPSDGMLTEQQFLELIARQRGLNFPPGEQFLYSNTGYALLSIVVKRASGQSLRDFAAARIFAPLGMTHSEFRDDHTSNVPDRALGYQLVGTSYHLSEPRADVVGDGGMYSTLADLARWDANFETGVVGGKEGIALMQRPARLNGTDSIPYALGLTISSYRGLRTLSHSGAYGGYRTTLLRFPDQHTSVITLCNTATAPASLAQQVATVFLESQMQPQQVASIELPSSVSAGGSMLGRSEGDPAEARRRADELSSIAGSYYSADLDMPVSLQARDGALVMQRPNSQDIRFTALSDDLYTSRDQMLLLVLRNDDGSVSGFTLTVGRVRDLPFVRQAASRTGGTP